MDERARPLFSIGAVARMLDLPAATIRTWEQRYALVQPQRSDGGQRLFSREQVDQLRWVVAAVADGRRPAEAHRLLAERIAEAGQLGRERICVLLAESRNGAADVLQRLLGSDRFEVVLASDPAAAARTLEEESPALVVIDTDDEGFAELAERLRNDGTKVLPVQLLAQPLALLERARALAR